MKNVILQPLFASKNMDHVLRVAVGHDNVWKIISFTGYMLRLPYIFFGYLITLI